MPIKLAENFRAVFYAPYYATRALGFFAREGVDVELIDSANPGDAVSAVLDGSIDVTWGGPMRVMKARDGDPRSPLVCFCEVVARDPFFLVGRASGAPFKLVDLPRLRLATWAILAWPSAIEEILEELFERRARREDRDVRSGLRTVFRLHRLR